MKRKIDNLCVYCGSAFGFKPEFRTMTEYFGSLLAQQNIRLIYGGGRVGLMGALADATLAAGGEVIGVIPQALMDKEVGHGGLTELHVVGNMHERKMMMANYSDGFVALPGGWGTLEELTEMLTWRQLGIHAKPIGLLNVAGCYDGLLHLLQSMIDDGFVRAEHGDLLTIDTDPDRLLHIMMAADATLIDKWAEVPNLVPSP